MYIERQKKIQQRVTEQTNKFFSSFTITFASKGKTSETLLNVVNNFKEPINQGVNYILSQFNHQNQVPKTKSRLCGSILKKGDRAYKCYNCMTEQNSIICLGCFSIDKHQGHQFQLISVFGGCCDCGDQQKWKTDGFCKQHSGDLSMQIQLNQILLQTFIEQQHVGFKVLLFMYCKYVEQLKYLQGIKLQGQLFDQHDSSRMRDAIKKKIIVYFQNYSSAYFKQLIQFNGCGMYANYMTQKLFQSELDLSDLPLAHTTLGETNFFKLLFKLVMFDNTAERVCDLCITLFQLNKFRQTLTIQYINSHNNDFKFSNSFYSYLSSQLFTSYLAISKLVHQKRIPPLLMNPKVESYNDLSDSVEAYVRDLVFLSKLYGSASIDYFHYHAQQGKIVELGDYRRFYDKYPKANDYYGLQQIFVDKMVNVVKVMQREPSSFIMKSSLRQLYKFISSFKNNTFNYFRPQERLLAMISLVYLGGDIHKLQDQQTMIDYLAILGVNSLQEQVEVIISNICTVLSFAAHLLQNQPRITQNFTFYSFYFTKNQKLYNLDAILLKIMIKICQFHNKNYPQKIIDYSKIIKNGDKFNNIINKMQNYNNNFNIHIESTTKQDSILMGQQHLRHFVFYISLLNQAIVSDLPLLAIKCFLQPNKEQIKKYKLPQMEYQKQAYHYYQNLLKSCENKTITIKQFKTICQVLFKQQQIFKQFANNHMDTFDSRKLNAQKSKGQKINVTYFRSASIRAKGIDSNANLSYLPYFQMSRTVQFLRQDMTILSTKALEYLQNLQKSLQKQSVTNYKGKVENCYTQLFNLIWVIYLQTNNQELYIFITQSLKRQSIKHFLGSISKEVNNYQKIDNKYQLQIQSRESIVKKELLKEKLSNKKNLMKEKMNKNKDLFIPHPTIGEQDQQFCCICKQAKQNEENSFLAMIAQTNYNNWMYLKPSNQLYLISMCGHLVHKSCYQKTAKRNQIYTFCPLCKKPINIVIPTTNKKSFQSSYLDFFQQFHKIVKIHNSGSSKITQGTSLFLSLVAFAIIRGFVFPAIFKKQLKIYQALSQLLVHFIKVNTPECLFNENSQLISVKFQKQDSTVQDIFNYCSQRIFQKLSTLQIKKPQKQTFSVQFKAYAEKIISNIFNQTTPQYIQEQFQEIFKLKATITEPQIQANLSQLSAKHLGQCPNCSLITNQQAKCLICPNFVTCIKCQKMKLMSHAQLMHKHTASFIKTFTGEIVYVYRSRCWIFQSIYQDYIGRFYEAGTLKKSDYKLNPKKLAYFREDVINISIQSNLRYKQKESNKVIHDQQILLYLFVNNQLNLSQINDQQKVNIYFLIDFS